MTRKWCSAAKCSTGVFVLFTALLHSASAQVPPRLNIPGAVLVGNYPPALQRRLDGGGPPPQLRLRRPQPQQSASPAPLREVRPVVEEEEDNYAPPSQSIASFDAEVNKLSEAALASAVRQAQEEEAPQQQTGRPQQQQVQFRPDKIVPITRDQIREKPSPLDLPVFRPQQQRPPPITRQEQRPIARPPPPPRPIRPVVRQELDDEDENVPRQITRQKPRQQPPPQQQQVFRPAQHRPASRPADASEDYNKRRRPVVQILKKYRTDNPDGSITWGFENEDGTFKEETLGTDCTIKGKYGYVDPEGVRREFEYEAGNKCDPNRKEDDDEDEDLPPPPPQQPKKPYNSGKPQIQFRPQLAQY